MSALAAALLKKIESRTARTGVVGLGYVGLPLAVEFAAPDSMPPASTWTIGKSRRLGKAAPISPT